MEQIEKETMIGLPDESWAIINEYNLACTAIKEAEKRKEDAKLQLIALLGTAQIGICNDLKVTYSPQKRESVDSKLLQQQYPAAYLECLKTTEFMKMTIGKI